MRGRGLLLLGLLADLPLGAPALAGPAYVPFVAPEDPGPFAERSTVPSLELYNFGGQTRRYAIRFVAAGEDGSQGGQPVAAGRLKPAQRVTVSCCAGRSGVLVVTGAPQIAVGAHVDETFLRRPVPNEVRGRLPVLTARDALPAGTRAVLSSLIGDPVGQWTDSLGILNLGGTMAHCSVTGIQHFIFIIPELAAIDIPPGSVAAFPDVLVVFRGALVNLLVFDPLVTCDQPFYPFAILYGGNFNFLRPTLPWMEFVPPSVQLAGAPPG
jgi:hypothetical protein